MYVAIYQASCWSRAVLSCTVYLKSTYSFKNKDSSGSLDYNEEQLINNKNSFVGFFLRKKLL